MGRERVEWPVYPIGDPNGLGILISVSPNVVIVSVGLYLVLKAQFYMLHKKMPSEVYTAVIAAIIANTVPLPLIYKAFLPKLKAVTVKPDGLLIRRFTGKELVRIEDVENVEIREHSVVLKLRNGKTVRLPVLDVEGFVKTLREVWGIEA